MYHLIWTVDPVSQISLDSGAVIETELAKTNSNAAVRVKRIAEDLNIIFGSKEWNILFVGEGKRTERIFYSKKKKKKKGSLKRECVMKREQRKKKKILYTSLYSFFF